MGIPAALLPVKSPWLIGFGLVAVAQLAFVALGVSQAALITTWMLAPLLAGWVWRARGPGLLVLALMFCWGGDVLGNPRTIGIGPGGLALSVAAFAAANVCLVILFVRRGALAALWGSIGGPRRWRARIASLYIVAAIAGLWLTWSGLAPTLRVVASIYLLLLAATATTALAVDICAGTGAALFFGSELLIALAIAGRADAAATPHRLEVLALYMLGILLIAVGAVNREPGTKRRLQDDTGPAQRARGTVA